MASQSLPSVLPVMRQLLRLVRTLPDHQREAALFEMRDKVRARAGEADAAKVLEHRKELYSKLGYLRIIAPRAPANAPSGTSESTGSTTYVYRDGKFVEGRGETAGSRVNDGTIGMNEAMSRNAAHFERFYGRKKGPSTFF